METYSFRIILADADDIVDDMTHEKMLEMSDAVFEAGCDDSTPGVYCGELDVTFSREAENMVDAIRSAVEQVESVGCHMLKVVSPDQPTFDRINEELADRAQTITTTDR